ELFHQLVYEIRYDKFGNVTWYSRKGSNVVDSINDVVIGTINTSEYVYHVNNSYTYGDLFSFSAPFDNYSIDPGTGDYCFVIPSRDPGFDDYEDLHLCVPKYEFEPNSCSVPIGDNPNIELVFRKLIQRRADIIEKEYECTYHAPIIAKMEYFDRSEAHDRTNALKKHRIYIGADNATGFRRGTVAELVSGTANPDGIEVAHIYNCFEESLNIIEAAKTSLTYDTYGNVTSITGPDNMASQRLTTNFVYETDLNQYVQTISNDYGDGACFKYDHKTGNLLRQVDINGHA